VQVGDVVAHGSGPRHDRPRRRGSEHLSRRAAPLHGRAQVVPAIRTVREIESITGSSGAVAMLL